MVLTVGYKTSEVEQAKIIIFQTLDALKTHAIVISGLHRCGKLLYVMLELCVVS